MALGLFPIPRVLLFLLKDENTLVIKGSFLITSFWFSRVSSCKVYGAVPPPPPLLTRVQSELEAASSVTTPGGKTVISHITPPHPPPGTSYNGYGGIYPQTTPLQQVALALKQSTSPIISTQTQIIGNANLEMEKEKRPPHTHKRKFQELPNTDLGQPGQLKTHQVSVLCSLTS